MTDGYPSALSLTAALDLSDFRTVIFLALKLFIALVGAVLGWFLSAPLISLLYRLVFRRPTPKPIHGLGRLAAAVLAGVLVFLYFPLGSGGWGWGWGSGGGGTGTGGGKGSGTGTGSGDGPAGTAQGTAPVRTGKDTEAEKEPLPIELVVSERYKGDARYYLIKGQPPARTLDEVEKFLQESSGRWSRVDIIIYANSVSEAHPAVAALQKLIERHPLPWNRPPEFRDQVKTFKEGKG